MKKLMLFTLILLGSTLNSSYVKAAGPCDGKRDGEPCTVGTETGTCYSLNCNTLTTAKMQRRTGLRPG